MSLYGLMKNISNTVSDSVDSTVKDQYLEVFTCDSLGDSILVKRANRNNNKNNKGTQNIISAGSRIIVPEGTAMIATDGGKIIECSTEAGVFEWNSSTSKSILSGGSLKNLAGEAFERFKFAGEVAKDQRIYFINMLEIRDNIFAPHFVAPYKDPENRTVYVQGRIIFSFRICDPVVFFKNVSGNISGTYYKDEFVGEGSQISGEVEDVAIETISNFGGNKIIFSELPGMVTQIERAVKEAINSYWREKRGIEIVTMTLNMSIDGVSRARVEQLDQAKTFAEDPKALASHAVLGATGALNTAAEHGIGAVAAVGMVSNLMQCPFCLFKPETGPLGDVCECCGSKLNGQK